MNKIKTFQDLQAWQYGHQTVLEVYKIAKNFPQYEQFGLASQMRRSAISVTSNIAEAFGRWSKKEKEQFFSIASGSASELENQTIAARDVGYITDTQYNKLLELVTTTHKLLNGLRRTNKV